MKIYYNSKIAKLFTFIDGYKTIMLGDYIQLYTTNIGNCFFIYK